MRSNYYGVIPVASGGSAAPAAVNGPPSSTERDVQQEAAREQAGQQRKSKTQTELMALYVELDGSKTSTEQKTARLLTLEAMPHPAALQSVEVPRMKLPVFDESVGVDSDACPLVERVEGRVRGVPTLIGTSLPADSIMSNLDAGESAAEIAARFEVPEETVQAVIDYALDYRARSSDDSAGVGWDGNKVLLSDLQPYTSEFGIDWSGCDEVERVPGKVSGVPILKHSRVQADSVVSNADSCSVEEVADMFELPIEQVKAVVDYASLHRGDRAHSLRP
jgi:uncharacterized protein (DUF433 family)